jgi:translation initiation factor IF-2
LFDGQLNSLKRFQEDVSEVRAGFECGVGIAGFDNFEEGDVLEFYQEERVS